MKKTLHLVLMLAFSFCAQQLSAADAGDDAARHYKSNPDKYDGKKVDVDCAFVTRINGGPQVDGVVFFVAHTVDADNQANGGSIVVAVLEGDADYFMRDYGTAVERRNGKKGVDYERLRGTFRVLDRGNVYLDESGDAHALIEAHLDAHGKFALPGGGNSRKKF